MSESGFLSVQETSERIESLHLFGLFVVTSSSSGESKHQSALCAGDAGVGMLAMVLDDLVGDEGRRVILSLDAIGLA